MPLYLRFNYLYRDSGNYKKFGHKDYSNPGNLTIEDAEKLLRQYLIDEEFLYPEHAQIPKFRFHRYLDDYSWYEFENLEIVKGKRCNETFEELILRLSQEFHFKF
jgi:hypothetical protein